MRNPAPENDVLQSMPASHDAEEALLSCALQQPEAALSRLRWMTAAHFHKAANGIIWAELLRMADEQVPIDMTSLMQRMVDSKQIEDLGGPGYIAEIYTKSAVLGHLDHYAEMIAEKHRRREGIQALWDLQKAFWDESAPVSDSLTMAQARLFELQKKDGVKLEFQPIRKVVMESVESIESVVKRRGHVTGGLALGFTEIDRTFMGAKPGEVTIIAGRPAMGKSALMMNIAECVAMGIGHYREFDQTPRGVAYVTLEMGAVQNVNRVLLGRAGVNLRRLRDGFVEVKDKEKAGANNSGVNVSQMKKIGEEASRLAKANLHILDASNLDITTLSALLRQFVQRNKIELVVIDYLQLLKSLSRAAQTSRYVEVGEVSRGVKSIAKETGAHIIIGAQLGRDTEKRRDSQPRISDLRESGDIEQDADNIGLLHRPCYYASEKEREDESNDDLYCDLPHGGGRAEKASLIIGKQRDGPTGELPLAWIGELARFTSLNVHLNNNNKAYQQQH